MKSTDLAFMAQEQRDLVRVARDNLKYEERILDQMKAATFENGTWRGPEDILTDEVKNKLVVGERYIVRRSPDKSPFLAIFGPCGWQDELRKPIFTTTPTLWQVWL